MVASKTMVNVTSKQVPENTDINPTHVEMPVITIDTLLSRIMAGALVIIHTDLQERHILR